MVTRQRNFVRTPRKDKIWATFTQLESTLGDNQLIFGDLLADLKTDLGVSSMVKVTVMRIIGRLSLGNAVTATTTDPGFVFWGIAWVSSEIAALSPALTAIPDPAVAGDREAEWLQRGVLRGEPVIGANAMWSARGQLESFVDLDIRQMRKQPTPDSRLVLILNNLFSITEDVQLSAALATMVALP